MHTAAGATLIVVGAAVALVDALVFRPRTPVLLNALLLAAAGAAIGWGAILIQHHTSVADRAVAVAAIAMLVPLHVRVVFGGVGRRGR